MRSPDTDRLYHLVIKAPFSPEEIARRLPGASVVLEHRSDDRYFTATVRCPARQQERLIRWLIEYGNFDERSGFAPGTLLFYAERSED